MISLARCTRAASIARFDCKTRNDIAGHYFQICPAFAVRVTTHNASRRCISDKARAGRRVESGL